MHIPFTATNFFPAISSTFPTNSKLQVNWHDLVWSAITTGKPNRTYLLAHGWHSFAEQIVREFTVYANLRARGGICNRSTLYDSLDPTEKGATSYFMGMTMAKLFAFRLFDTPWLFHVSLAKAQRVNMKFKPNTKSQPDLIGQTRSGDWIVVEAKGRTNSFEQDALEKAKKQTRMIRQINGVDPWLRVAAQAFFDPALSVHLDDPPEFDPRAWDLQLEMETAYKNYYAFTTALQRQRSDTLSTRSVHGRTFLAHSDRESGVVVGIDKELLAILSESTGATLSERMLKYASHAGTDGTAEFETHAPVYPDGVLVELDGRWSHEQMLREPHQRSAG